MDRIDEPYLVKQKYNGLQRKRFAFLKIRPSVLTHFPCFSALYKYLRTVLISTKLFFDILIHLAEPRFPIVDNRTLNKSFGQEALLDSIMKKTATSQCTITGESQNILEMHSGSLLYVFDLSLYPTGNHPTPTEHCLIHQGQQIQLRS